MYNMPLDQPDAALAPFFAFLSENERYFADGTLHGIYLSLYPGDGWMTGETYIELHWKTDIRTGRIGFTGVNVYQAKDETEKEAIKERYEAAAGGVSSP